MTHCSGAASRFLTSISVVRGVERARVEIYFVFETGNPT
jgi:hypothetical protein